MLIAISVKKNNNNKARKKWEAVEAWNKMNSIMALNAA